MKDFKLHTAFSEQGFPWRVVEGHIRSPGMAAIVAGEGMSDAMKVSRNGWSSLSCRVQTNEHWLTV